MIPTVFNTYEKHYKRFRSKEVLKTHFNRNLYYVQLISALRTRPFFKLLVRLLIALDSVQSYL